MALAGQEADDSRIGLGQLDELDAGDFDDIANVDSIRYPWGTDMQSGGH